MFPACPATNCNRRSSADRDRIAKRYVIESNWFRYVIDLKRVKSSSPKLLILLGILRHATPRIRPSRGSDSASAHVVFQDIYQRHGYDSK